MIMLDSIAEILWASLYPESELTWGEAYWDDTPTPEAEAVRKIAYDVIVYVDTWGTHCG